jgi:hypothetical protein
MDTTQKEAQTQTWRRQEICEVHAANFAWKEVKRCKDDNPGMINVGLAMSIACHVAHKTDKKSSSGYDWELSERQFRGRLTVVSS